MPDLPARRQAADVTPAGSYPLRRAFRSFSHRMNGRPMNMMGQYMMRKHNETHFRSTPE